MYKKKLLVMALLVIMSTNMVGCNGQESEGAPLGDLSKEINENEDVVEKSEVNTDGMEELLRDLGLNTEIINEGTVTKGGANLLGGARPARSYRSLGDAQDAFQDYLGLHNQIESITDVNYELTNIFIIDNSFMQAIYSVEDTEQILTIKFSRELVSKELAEVYFQDNNILYTEEGSILGVDYKIYKNEPTTDMYNLAWFDTHDGKAYSIETKYGLTRDSFNKLLDELIWNVTSMGEWVSVH